MTSIIAASAVAVVLLLGIATYYLVGTLRQATRTARAAEEFLLSARPRIEETTDRVNGILRRADLVMGTVEQGVAAFIPARPGKMSTLVKAFTTASAVVTGATQVARLFFNRKESRPESEKEECNGQ